VQDGEIVARSVAPVVTSTYALTQEHFTDFRLTLQVKLVESEVHSGISLWGEVPTPHHGDDAHTYAGHLVCCENMSGCPMSLTSLECQVSKWFNSDTCPRPTTQIDLKCLNGSIVIRAHVPRHRSTSSA
jgi:hypothetical protein